MCFRHKVCSLETLSVLLGADIFICVYICWCVYICIQRKGCIYSLHAAGNGHFTALPEPRPCRSKPTGFLPRPCARPHRQPGRPGCGNKTVNVQDLAAFLLVYKLFGGKNDVSHNLINILIVQTPFLPSQPRIAHHFVWSLPHKRTLKPHVLVTVLCFFLLMEMNLKSRFLYYMDGVWTNISDSCCLPSSVKAQDHPGLRAQHSRALFCLSTHRLASTGSSGNEPGSEHVPNTLRCQKSAEDGITTSLLCTSTT